MNIRNQKTINILNMASDFFIIFRAWYISLWLRFIFLKGNISLLLWKWPFTIVPVLYSLSMVVAYYCCRMYGSYRFKAVPEETAYIFIINRAGCVALMSVLFLFKISDFSRGVILLYWLTSCLLLVAKRLIVRGILRHFNMLGYRQKHVVLFGSSHHAQQYAEDVKNNPLSGIIIDGYFGSSKKEKLGRYLGSYESLEQVLQENETDEIIVALETNEIDYIKYVIACADKEGVRISLIPFYNNYIPPNVRMNVIGRSKLIDMRATPLDNVFASMMKRLMDIIGSLVLIVLFSPIMILTAIGVKVSSPGPVFFRQNRVGLHKKPFVMLKFRSMKVNDTENTGWSRQTDPRKTYFGSIIRKFSIDELPQLFNVLKGDMSLVGPRPEIPYYVREFKEDVPRYLVRQQIRPGMTGWAQVNGLRGDTSIEARVEYDIWYIENWSLWLDIKILFRTAFGGMINNETIN